MERLTVADDILENGKRRCHLIDGREVRNHAMEFYWRLKEYEDLGLTPERIEVMQQHNHILIEQLAEYQRLEKQGLLLKLPCKVGDTLYRPLFDLDDVVRVKDIIVDVVSVYFEEDKELNAYIVGHIEGTNIGQDADFSDFGKNIFTTKEEAEAKLQESQNGVTQSNDGVKELKNELNEMEGES